MERRRFLDVILDSSELESISDDFRTKLDGYIAEKEDILNELKNKHEKLKVDSEHQYVELEKQLLQAQHKYQQESFKSSTAEKKLSECEVKYNNILRKLKAVEENNEDSNTSKLRLNKAVELLEADKRELSQLIDRKNNEIKILNDEHGNLTSKLNDANNKKCEALAQLEELMSREVSIQFKEKRFSQEKTQLEDQVSWLNDELRDKCNELLNYRKEKSSHQLRMEGDLQEKTEEVSKLRESLDSQQKMNEEKESRIEDLISRLKDSRESYSQIDEHYRNELASQQKLVDLYKDLSEQGESHVKEYANAMEEMQRRIEEFHEANKNLEQEKEYITSENQKQMTSRDETINSLRIEIQHANELIVALKASGGIDVSGEGIDDLCPTAAATSRLLKSGKTLTEIYSEYVQVVTAYDVEKEENKRLTTYLDQILKEIEEKAPILKKQRRDYETALETIDNMTHQLNAALIEREKLQLSADEMQRKASHHERECSRSQQQQLDLSRQVRYLVKEVEELRGGKVDWNEEAYDEVSSSSQLISEQLVTFRSIKELQEKNQSLIAVVRDLSEQREREEKETSDTRIQELKEQVEKLREEVEQLNHDRKRQYEMVESVVRQRDMYRVLLSQTKDDLPPKPSMTSTPLPSQSLPEQKDPEVPTLDITLHEAQTALAEYKAKYETFCQEKTKNEELLTEQLNNLREELNKFRVQNTKLTSELEFSNERYKVIQGNANAFKKEADAQMEKGIKYSAAILKHEHTISALQEDFKACHQERTQLQVQIQQYKLERDLAKKAEERLVHERETMFKEQKYQNLLLANLQAIKNNMEHADFESKSKLTNKIESLEGEVSSLRRQMNSEADTHQSAIQFWKSQVEDIRKELDDEMNKRQDAQKLLILSQTSEQDLKQEISTLQAKIITLEKHQTYFRDIRDSENSEKEAVVTATPEKLDEKVKDLQMQLDQSLTEVLALRSQLSRQQEQIIQYRNVAMSVENSLSEQNEVSKKFKEVLEKQMEEAKKENELLNERIIKLEKEKLELIDENSDVLKDINAQNSDLRIKMAAVQTELQETLQQMEKSSVIESAARADTAAQAKIAAEAQEKYEKEVMLHVADVEALNNIKSEMSALSEKVQSVEQDAVSAKAQLFKSQASWEEELRILSADKAALETKYEEVLEEKLSLHQQMEKLTNDMISVQEKAMTSLESDGNTSISEDAVKSSQQLLEVIKFLRKEKQISETKLEVMQSECNRLKQQTEYTEKRLEESEKLLNEERTNAQVNVQTAAQHAELLRKVENVTLLSDSNKLLREERDSLLTSMKESNIKIKKYEDELFPVRLRVRDLEAECQSFASQKENYEEEIGRWKSRTNQLIEQTNQVKPEDHQRIVSERDQLKRQLANSNTEFHKQKQEQESLKRSLNSANEEMKKLSTESDQAKSKNNSLAEEVNKLKSEISSATEENRSLRSEITAVKNNCASHMDEISNLNTQITKFNTESEEKNKTIAQLKKLGRKYKDQAERSGKVVEDLKEQVNQSQTLPERQTASDYNADKLSAAEVLIEELTTKLQDGEKQQQEVQQKLDRASKELSECKDAIKQLTSDKSEYLKREENLKKLLQNVRCTLSSQMSDLEKCNNTKDALEKDKTSLQQSNKELEMRVRMVTNQYEDKDRELNEVRKSLQSDSTTATVEKLQAENSELLMKIQQIQKQQERVVSAPLSRPAGTAVAERAGTSQVEIPPMANIRPITTSAGAVRHSAPVQPVLTSISSVKATASIRPMAIAPTSTAQSVAGATPTATVMPVAQDAHEVSGSGASTATSPSVVAAARPSQQILRVAPQIEQPIQESSSGQVSQDEGMDAGAMEPSTSSHVPAPKQLLFPTFSSSSIKRNRESEGFNTDSECDSQQVKKSKLQEQVIVPQITVTDEAADVTSASPGDPNTQDGQFEPEDSMDEASSDVIILSDEDNAEPVECEDDDEDNSDFDIVDEDNKGDENDLSVEYQESEGDSNDAGHQLPDIDRAPTTEQLQSGEHDAAEVPTLSSYLEGQSAVSPRTFSGMQPVISHVTSISTSDQVAPFLLATQTSISGIDEADDCRVPSTPTLFLPRRSDLFPETLRASTSESRSDSAVLASQGGMDDTKMDLTQLHDPGSRIVPSLSRQSTTQDSISSISPDAPIQILPGADNCLITQTSEAYISPSSDVDHLSSNELDLEGDLGEEDEATRNEPSPVEFVTAVHTTLSTINVAESTISQSEMSAGQVDVAVSPADSSTSQVSTEQGTANRPRIQRIVWDDISTSTENPPSASLSSFADISNQTLPPIVRPRRSQPVTSSQPFSFPGSGAPVFGGRATFRQFGAPHRGRNTARRGPRF